MTNEQLIELARKYNDANARYMNLCLGNTPTDPQEMVRYDLKRRAAMREMMRAKETYDNALDAYGLDGEQPEQVAG